MITIEFDEKFFKNKRLDALIEYVKDKGMLGYFAAVGTVILLKVKIQESNLVHVTKEQIEKFIGYDGCDVLLYSQFIEKVGDNLYKLRNF